MLTRLRTRWFAGGAAMLLVLAMSGAAFGADSAGDSAAPPDDVSPQVIVPNGSDCATDPGTGQADENEAGETDENEVDESDQDENEVDENEQGENEQGDCDETETPDAEAPTDEETETGTEDAAKADTPCVEVPAPPFDPAIFNGPGAFGAYVSSVAGSDAVGGKNCNHGGAVSAAVHAAKAAAKAERDAAKAAAKAERDAAKAQRATDRAAAKAARDAAKHGKGNGH